MSDVEDDVFGDSPAAQDDDLQSIHDDDEVADGGNGDLFGDDGGADLDGKDPFGEEMDEDEDRGQDEERHLRVQDMDIFRHRIPRSKDGRVQSFKVPKFLRFTPEPYDPRTFQPTQADIDNARSEVYRPTVRHMIDPETGALRSNARMYRWSDGSMSMSVGGEHYTVLSKPTAPDPTKPYDELKDGHNYAAAAHLDSSVFVIVGHMSEEYTVRQNKQHEDEALQRLAMRIREATSTHGNTIIKTTHDPEQQRRLAEQAEKEQMKQQRRRDNQAGRQDGPGGGSRSRGGGLGIDDLEGGAKSRPRKRNTGTASSKRRTNSNMYSDDDEDMGYGGGRGANDYDKEDDFIASSGDEEEEAVATDEEEEELEDDEDDKKKHRKRQKSEEEDSDEEAAPTTRRKRRVVDDDDDSE